jgi:hypothetical protein
MYLGGWREMANHGSAELNTQLKSYEEGSRLNFPETISKLQEVSRELRLTLDERRKMDELEAQVTDLKNRNQDLLVDLERPTRSVSEPRATIDH